MLNVTPGSGDSRAAFAGQVDGLGGVPAGRP